MPGRTIYHFETQQYVECFSIQPIAISVALVHNAMSVTLSVAHAHTPSTQAHTHTHNHFSAPAPLTTNRLFNFSFSCIFSALFRCRRHTLSTTVRSVEFTFTQCINSIAAVGKYVFIVIVVCRSPQNHTNKQIPVSLR